MSGMRLEEAIQAMTELGATYPEVNIMTDFVISSPRSITR
jgi:hypothetical protein